jgi:AcrR family transcriptional regulator
VAAGRATTKTKAEGTGGGAADVSVAGIPLSNLVAVNGAGPRSKRAAILDTAVSLFGETGYEATKWSMIADEVGIGQTALYHYFESKDHCLLTIMRLELARSYERFLIAAADRDSIDEAVEQALVATFEVSPAEIRQLRILMAHGDLLPVPRQSEREETERKLCLELTRQIEKAWTDLLGRKLAVNNDPRDTRLLSLAVLGLINSVWRWFRPGGRMALKDVSRFYVDCALQIVG